MRQVILILPTHVVFGGMEYHENINWIINDGRYVMLGSYNKSKVECNVYYKEYFTYDKEEDNNETIPCGLSEKGTKITAKEEVPIRE